MVLLLTGTRDYFLQSVATSAVTHPASSCSVGAGALSLEVKWLECEADHLPLSSVKVKNE
jgi:hypothetical protein